MSNFNHEIISSNKIEIHAKFLKNKKRTVGSGSGKGYDISDFW